MGHRPSAMACRAMSIPACTLPYSSRRLRNILSHFWVFPKSKSVAVASATLSMSSRIFPYFGSMGTGTRAVSICSRGRRMGRCTKMPSLRM